jgi:hypothetical protein
MLDTMTATRERVKAAHHHDKPFFPAKPFREWIERLIEKERYDYDWRPTFNSGERALLPAEARVAGRLGVSPRQLRRFRDTRTTWLREDSIDHACTIEGSIHIAELYPAYWEIAEAGGARDLLKIQIEKE